MNFHSFFDRHVTFIGNLIKICSGFTGSLSSLLISTRYLFRRLNVGKIAKQMKKNFCFHGRYKTRKSDKRVARHTWMIFESARVWTRYILPITSVRFNRGWISPSWLFLLRWLPSIFEYISRLRSSHIPRSYQLRCRIRWWEGGWGERKGAGLKSSVNAVRR